MRTNRRRTASRYASCKDGDTTECSHLCQNPASVSELLAMLGGLWKRTKISHVQLNKGIIRAKGPQDSH